MSTEPEQYVRNTSLQTTGGPDDGPRVIYNPASLITLDCRIKVRDGQVFIQHPDMFYGAWALMTFDEDAKDFAIAAAARHERYADLELGPDEPS